MRVGAVLLCVPGRCGVSRTNPDRFERLGLKARCHRCGANPGEWCRTDRMFDAAELHANRSDHLIEAYWQGYDDAKGIPR